MSKYLPAVMLLAGPALARSEPKVTSIKAGSDCVAIAAVNTPTLLQFISRTGSSRSPTGLSDPVPADDSRLYPDFGNNGDEGRRG